MSANIDAKTVEGFGDEWSAFDQSAVSEDELREIFDSYFAIFPWSRLPEGAVGFDLGCGSGRWARLVVPRVGRLVCLDASPKAVQVARRRLAEAGKCDFVVASAAELPLADGSMDFGYSLGVLHHVPDTQAGIRDAVAKLRPGAPLLLYLYYALDNRPWWYVLIYRVTDLMRRAICRLPFPAKYVVTQVIAATVYLPLARLARLVERLGLDASRLPLAFYRHRSLYSMRTDALDRFGTRLEKRFSRVEIEAMMTAAGLEKISFSPSPPYWCVVGFKADRPT